MCSIARAKRRAAVLAVTGTIVALIVGVMTTVGRPTVAEETAAPPIIPGYGPAIPLREFEWHRPANFFRGHINREPVVCKSLLRSLNEPYDPQPDDRPSLILLQNKYLMPWRGKRYAWESKKYGTEGVDVWPQIVGDLDGDGKVDAVYRWSVAGKWNYSDVLFFSPSPQFDELSDDVLSFDRYLDLRGREVRPYSMIAGLAATNNALVIRYERLRPYIPNLYGIGNYQDIVSVEGREYLLTGGLPYITDPGDPRQVDPKYLATVTLFAIHPDQYFEPKCQFLAKTFLVMR